MFFLNTKLFPLPKCPKSLLYMPVNSKVSMHACWAEKCPLLNKKVSDKEDGNMVPKDADICFVASQNKGRTDFSFICPDIACKVAML